MMVTQFAFVRSFTMLVTAVVLSLLGVVACRPQSSNMSHVPISEQDRVFLRSLPAHRGSYPAGFKETYVARNGQIVHGYKPSGQYVKVIGSPGASQAAVNRVAGEVYKMLRHAPPQIFSNLANHNAGVGVFKEAEKMMVFPEYASLRDTPACRGRCDGSCAHTCTFDGRKWETVGGAGGSLAVVEEENVMCTSNDPYRRHDNIAVHEFSHTIDGYGFDSTMKRMKEEAYNNARAHSLWRTNAYGMANSAEYFAEATGAFFVVNLQNSPGGMNECHGANNYCRTEAEARYHIYQRDSKLYYLLVYVYTNNQGTVAGGLTVCP